MPGLDKMREAQTKEEQPTAPAQSDGFATAADFRNRLKTSSLTLQDGLTMKFRALLPIDRQTITGSAVTTKMIEAGLDFNDLELRQTFVDQLPSLARIEIVTEAAKDTIIQAVIEPQFTAVPPEQCPPNKVSVQDLSPTEILEIDAAIRKFSGGDEEEEIFRGTGGADAEDTGGTVADGETEHVDGGTDSEGVQSEPV